MDAKKRDMTVYGAPRPELPTWPKLLRNLADSAPGKQAFVSDMKQQYPTISEFNRTYGTSFAAWTDVLRAENWRPNTDYQNDSEIRDNTRFLRTCVETYYRKALHALRRYDGNHLFFGDKLNANSNGLETVIDITSQYTDVTFYQMYAPYEDQVEVLDLIDAISDLPVINGDSAYSILSDMMPNPYGPHATSQAVRADWTRAFAVSSFSRPSFTGWHMCGVVDTWKTMPGKDGKQHAGLMTPTGEYYPEMEAVVKEISDSMYDLHASS